MGQEAGERGVALPTDRAFVVQLASVHPGADPFRGRIEHLATGQVARFDSLERLREFVEQVLAPPPDASPATQGRDEP